MSRFIHVDYPSSHPGVDRFEQTVDSARNLFASFQGARGVATLLLAAIVSALVVVANELVEQWTEGHLLAAWVIMWAVGFSALVLFAEPARRLATTLRAELQAWAAARREAAADERLWQVAMSDARVMADISRAMNLSTRAQRLMRSYY